MRTISLALFCAAVSLALNGSVPVLAQGQPAATAALAPLSQRIIRYDRTKVRESKATHGGLGSVFYTQLLGPDAVDAPLAFLHRGYIAPGSSIGQHFHNRSEEMFFILDGEAQFTIDGRTSLIRGPASAPDRLGHAHAVLNPTDKPVEWMNINVSMGGPYDAFNLGDPRANVPLDPIPQFISTRYDTALLRPVQAARGGKGSVQYRRALDPTVFNTPWAYVDHMVIPPGASYGPNANGAVAEIVYVLHGAGRFTEGTDAVTVNADEIAPIRTGEKVTIANEGSAPLELLVIGIAKDMATKEALLNAPRASGR